MRGVRLRRRGVRLIPRSRQVILRSGDRLRYLRLPPWFQVLTIVLCCAIVGWGAVATVGWKLDAAAYRNVSTQLLGTEQARQRLAAKLAKSEDMIAGLSRSLASRDRRVERFAKKTEALRDELVAARVLAANWQAPSLQPDTLGEAPSSYVQALADKVDQLTAEYEPLLAERDNLELTLRSMETHLSSLAPNLGDMRSALELARAELVQERGERERIAANYDVLQSELAGTRSALNDARSQSMALRRDLATAETRLRNVTDEHRLVLVERDQLALRVDQLERRFANLADDQTTILARLGERTADTLSTVERTVTMTGLEVDHLLGRLDTESQPQGGPFIAADLLAEPVDEMSGRIANLEAQIDRLENMQRILAVLPLAPPMDNAWTTSNFGPRRDPITGQLAIHHGLDLASRPQSPIYATSPGRISFVGWKGGYGKVVEIDHGLGVRTRYGHMSKIFVKRGQLVEFHERIGQLGNTGRSTGAHLHYEVLVDGRPHDPSNFLRAGKYVFKQ